MIYFATAIFFEFNCHPVGWVLLPNLAAQDIEEFIAHLLSFLKVADVADAKVDGLLCCGRPGPKHSYIFLPSQSVPQI